MTDCSKCANRSLPHCRPCPVMQGLVQAATARREIDREIAEQHKRPAIRFSLPGVGRLEVQ